MDQIDRPVITWLCGSKFETVHAESLIVLSVGVRRVTNDSLRSTVITSPVASPSWELAVSVDIVTSEKDTFFVRSQDGVVDSDGVGV